MSRGAGVVSMAQFEEVLDEVRSVLTWASPAEVQALLEGLVEDRIISEAYSSSLGLHRLTEAPAPQLVYRECKLSDDLDWACHPPGSAARQHLSQGQLSQVRTCGSKCGATDHKLESASAGDEHDRPQMNPLYERQAIHRDDPKPTQEPWEGTAMDQPYLGHMLSSTLAVCDHHRGLRLTDEASELLRITESMQEPESDEERFIEGNLQEEKEWLEQVEEAARMIAVPLWQRWDRGQRMLPLVTAGRSPSESTEADGKQCSALGMEEETELTAACRALEVCHLKYAELETLDTEVLYVSTCDNAATTFGAARNASPEDACAATDANNNITDKREGLLEACWLADRTRGDLCGLAADAQCVTDCGLPEDTFAHLLSSCAQGNSFYSGTGCSTTAGAAGNLENASRTALSTTTHSADGGTDFLGGVDSRWDAKMHEVDQDSFFSFDLGDLLPDDLSELMNEDFLDTEVLFGDPRLNNPDEPNYCTDIIVTTKLPGPDDDEQQRQETKTGLRKTKNKRRGDPPSTLCADGNPRAKRRRATGKPTPTEAPAEPAANRDADTGSGPWPAEMLRDLPPAQPRILHFYPSHSGAPIPIQFITIPESSGYQVVQLSPPPPVIRFPLPSTAATPTYIFVPAASPPCKRQVPPLSPVDGAVAPVLMSSSPPGSLSDTASKAMSPPCASPLSPSHETSPCRPQSPTAPDVPQVVKDYIEEAKAHTSQTCQDMEAGLRLTSHYVDVRVSRREILRSGKNTNKCLDKELVIMGDTDRQMTSLGRRQIFDGSNGDKSKRYVLLLGNAGMGKTSLIQKLCLDWSSDALPQFDFVFLLDGKELTLTEPIYSLQTLLLNLSSVAPPCTDPEAVYAQILAAPKRVLVVFDGFDMLRDFESLLQTQEKDLMTSLQRDSKAQTFTVRQLYAAVLQRVLLPGCTLLLSTRPRGSASQLLRRTDSLVELCGFTPAHVETYLSQYFTDPALRASALDCLESSSYLPLLCWNPGLCRLVCWVLEQSKGSQVLPRTLTGLCHHVLCLKMKQDGGSTRSHEDAQTQISAPSVEEPETQTSDGSRAKRCHRSRAQVHTTSRTRKTRRAGDQCLRSGVDEEVQSGGGEVDSTEDTELLSQLSSLAWEGVKANSSTVPAGRAISAKLRALGLRTGLFLSHRLRTRSILCSGDKEGGGGGGDGEEIVGRDKGERKEDGGRTHIKTDAAHEDHILLWANPFLQSYMAAVHLSLSRTVSDRTFLQTLPFQLNPKRRQRPQREELELTQRFAVGLLFHNGPELHWLHSYTESAFREMVVSKQALVTKHLEGLSYGGLSAAQLLEACHYVYEASFTDDSRDAGGTRLLSHLAASLPENLTLDGVPVTPPEVFAVQNALERGAAEGRSFCLDLENSGIQICGLRALAGLNNINTYRACIADVITLWEQLEQSGEEGLLQAAVSKFKIHPLKATRVCHIEHLAKLVNIHVHRRLSDSCSQSVLGEGVPAVRELHKLEFELGPENGPLALPKLWELLPGLHNLQHLDLEKSKIGDKGAEKLADALVSLGSLKELNLSQNCIGDQGVKKLTTALKHLPKLHWLSLDSNVVSDDGAESLAGVLPHMASLTNLDVAYNKLTDVGAQSLGASLRNCKRLKTLRLWNQCIPLPVLERLQQQDHRIKLP